MNETPITESRLLVISLMHWAKDATRYRESGTFNLNYRLGE